ncbi:MAG: hypothetical protein ACYDAG_16020 [Chloroflexota bacterium]
MFSIQQCARQAIDVQDASSISGVAHTLNTEIIPALRAAGVHDIGAHPVTRLFVLKLVSLCGQSAVGDQFGESYGACLDMSEDQESVLPVDQPRGPLKLRRLEFL